MFKKDAYSEAFDAIFVCDLFDAEESEFLANYAVNHMDDKYFEWDKMGQAYFNETDEDGNAFWDCVAKGDEYLSDAKDAWDGCGEYQICWSDGSTFGNPVNYSSVVELAENLASAGKFATETHLPYAEKCN